MSVGHTGLAIFRTGGGGASIGHTGLSMFRAGGAGAPAGNGLLNNLILYSAGNEFNGDRLDLHVNALHLTDVNTVTSNPGNVYPLARQYTRANSEYHTRPGDDALLSMGDVDCTIACWCYMDTVINIDEGLVAKDALGGGREYCLGFDGVGTQQFTFAVSPDGTVPSAVYHRAATFGLPVINTWYLVVAWHDSVANTLNIQVNDGAVDSQAYALGVFDGLSPLRIGSASSFTMVGTFDGRIGPTCFWKSAAGGGGVLTAAQRTALYAGGAGLTYAAFTV